LFSIQARPQALSPLRLSLSSSIIFLPQPTNPG
jgi:hypothetical protein